MELSSLIQAYLSRNASANLINSTIRSERTDDTFTVSPNSCQITQSKEGAFQISGQIIENEALALERSHERIRRENNRRIDRKDALYFEAETTSGLNITARIFWACITVTHDARGTTHSLSANLDELIFEKRRRGTAGEHNTYLIYQAKDLAPPCDIRAAGPEHCAVILKADWSGNNSHKPGSPHDVLSFRDSSHHVIVAHTASRQDAQALRLNTDACFSFLLGRSYQSLGILYIDGEAEVFLPLSPAAHGAIYPRPIKLLNPYHAPGCAAFWDAFSKLRECLNKLNAEAAADLRRAINKPLQLPADSSIELRLMLLSIAIETLAMSVLPVDRAKYVPPAGIQNVIAQVSGSGEPADTVNRAKKMLELMLKPAAKNVLAEFSKRMRLESFLTKRWREVRGRLVHGKGLDYDNIDQVMKDYDIMLMLHHTVILSSAGYTGPIANHLLIGERQNLILSANGIIKGETDQLM